jgi:S1-C subfamily serine protease
MRRCVQTLALSVVAAVASPASAQAQEGGQGLGAPPAREILRAAAEARPSPAIQEGVESRIQLRPVDRATVRVVSVGGAVATAFDSKRTGLKRVVAVPEAAHGTGVVVEPDGLVLTARHVTWNSDAIAVLLPGSDLAMPARVVYVDPEHDIAFLQVHGSTPHHIRLPERPRPLGLSERLSASGYPIDIQQRYPAAVSGELSRENNDGSLQVAMSVNPGNSGGPVIDEAGHLVGLVSRRGEPRAGVAGIAFLEPLRFILAAYRAARDARASGAPTFAASDATMARIVADFVRTTDERPIYEQTSFPTVRDAARDAKDPAAALIVAAHAWNMHIALLEARRKAVPTDLQPADQAVCEQLRNTAMGLSRRALQEAPYLRLLYPIARSIVTTEGRSYVFRAD